MCRRLPFVVVVASAAAVFPLALLGAGCLSDSALPPDANVSCASTDECPRGYVCEAGRCEDATGNRPPRLSIAGPGRAAGDIDLDVTVFDANDDDVALSAVVIDGADVPVNVELTPDHVKASADGVTKRITVAAPALPDDGLHGTLPRDVVIRLTAADATRSANADVHVLAGNEAPQVHALEVDNESGLVTLRFVVSDSSSDPVDITSFAVSAADGEHSVPIDVTSFPAGGTTGIATSPEGQDVVLEWNSATAPFAENVTLSFTVADAFGGAGEGHVSFLLDNAPVVGAPVVDDSALPGGVNAEVGGPSDASGAHTFGALPLLAALDDPNCATGDETVSLTVKFAVEDASGGFGPLTDATLVGAPGSLDDIVADNVEQPFAWDVTADVLGLAVPSADVTVEDTDRAPGVEALDPVPVRQLVKVSVTATDSSSEALADTADAVFVIGNDPPVVGMSAFTGVHGGDVPIAFTVADSSADPSSVQIEFKRDASLPDSEFRPIAVRAGILDQLFTGTSASSFLVLWNSLAEPNDAEPRAPQGIGRALLPNAVLRIRAFDEPSLGVRHFSSWQVVPVSLSNQSKPRIEPVLVSDQGGLRNGTVPIVYRILDEESDPVHVVFEHSLDGVKFVPCTEAPTAQSEGTLGLASAPAALGGIVHTFMWDTSADIIGAQPSVRLRARAVDPFIDPTDDDAVPVFTLLQPAPFDPLPASGPSGAFTVRTQPAPTQSFFQVDTGDVDGDGNDEVVVAFNVSATEHIQVFDGNANGALVFAREVTSTAAGASGRPHVVDIDGDGALDVLFEGGRFFRGPALTDAGLVVNPCTNCRVAVADVDGDGVNDGIFINEDDTVRVMRVRFGRGVGAGWSASVDGNPTAPIAVPAAFGTIIAVGDIDGDGRADLVGNTTNTFPPVLTLFRASGSSAAGDAAFTAFAAPLTVSGLALKIVDADGDGDGDIVINDDTAGVMSLLVNDGIGGFGVADAVDSVTFTGGPIGVGDFNGDGALDFAVSSATEQAIVVALGRPDPANPGFISSARVVTSAVTFETGVLDVDGNGRPDIVTQVGLGGPSGLLGVLLTGLSPVPAAASASAARAMLDGGASQALPLVTDTDRDGALDLVMTVENGFPEVAHGAREGAVTTRWSLTYGAPQNHFSNNPLAKSLADVDGDGVADLLAIHQNVTTFQCELQVWRGGVDDDGVPDGTYDQVSGTPLANCPFGDAAIATCDVNGDHRLDVVLPDNNSRFLLLSGDGTGAFTSASIDSGVPGFLASVACADFDHDGFDDVVATEDQSNTGNAAAVANAASFRGSAGGLVARVPFTYGIGGAFLRVSDVDDDGLLDVVSIPGITSSGQAFHILHDNAVAAGAPLSFTPQLGGGALAQGQPKTPILADVDLDGALDMAFVMPDPFPTNVFLHPGTHSSDRPLGNFGTATEIVSNKNRIGLTVADVTADGAPDLVSTDFFGANVNAFVGRTSLPFTSVAHVVSAAGASGVLPFAAAGASVADVAFLDDAGGPFTQRAAIGVRRISGGGDVLAGYDSARAVDGAGGGDLASLLRRTGSAAASGAPSGRVLTGAARPLCAPVFATGDVRLVRVPDPSGAAGDTRIALVPAFGARTDPSSSTSFTRTGLDLSGGGGGTGAVSGVEVDVPFLNARTASGTVRVLLGVPRYRTAVDVASDPLSTAADAARFLPVRIGADGARHDVIDVSYDWLDVGAGDVDDAAALGKRFEVDATGKRVRVLTDELGVIAIFDGVSP